MTLWSLLFKCPLVTLLFQLLQIYGKLNSKNLNYEFNKVLPKDG